MTEPGSADVSGGSQSTQKRSVPRNVQLAHWLWIASAVVGFVRSIVQVSDRESLVSGLHEQMPQWSQEQVNSVTNSTILSTILLSLAILAVYASLATRMSQGRNWARIVITVIGGLRTVGTLFVLLALATLGMATLTRVSGVPLGATDIVFSLVTAMIDIAALVFMFLPDANKYFRESARLRRSPR